MRRTKSLSEVRNGGFFRCPNTSRGILCFLLVCAVVGIIYYRNACEMLRCSVARQEELRHSKVIQLKKRNRIQYDKIKEYRLRIILLERKIRGQ